MHSTGFFDSLRSLVTFLRSIPLPKPFDPIYYCPGLYFRYLALFVSCFGRFKLPLLFCFRAGSRRSLLMLHICLLFSFGYLLYSIKTSSSFILGLILPGRFLFAVFVFVSVSVSISISVSVFGFVLLSKKARPHYRSLNLYTRNTNSSLALVLSRLHAATDPMSQSAFSRVSRRCGVLAAVTPANKCIYMRMNYSSCICVPGALLLDLGYIVRAYLPV